MAQPDPRQPASLDATVCPDHSGLGGVAGLEPSAYGTPSIRRAKATQIYKKTGNLRAVQLLLGHTKMHSTVRYLGVDTEDPLSLSKGPTCSFLAGRRAMRRSALTCRSDGPAKCTLPLVTSTSSAHLRHARRLQRQ